MIRAWLIGTEDTIARIERIDGGVRKALRTRVEVLAIRLQGLVKTKLSGQVLKVVTGLLRRSINKRVEEGETSVIGQVGTPVEYAPPHEYGADIVVNVREHLRRSRTQMQSARFRTNAQGIRVEIKSMRGNRPAGSAVVRAHQRHMVMPERSFLRSSLRDMTPEIRTGLEEAVVQGAQQGFKR